MSKGGLDPATAEQLRELAPHVLGAVVRRHRDFAAAEDAVQEALLAAITDWPQRGLPRNPGGWLFEVACRRLADHQDAERARARREARAAAARPELVTPPAGGDEFRADDDDTLQLLFLCCHPALTPAAAIPLTLRAVGGLTTAAIAQALLVPEATIAQRIRRAKQAIAASGLAFAPPAPAERELRLGSVLHVLYLIFSEGHTTASGPELLRGDLCSEAVRLARTLHRLLPEHKEVTSLLALLLLTDARRAARTGPDGELIPLPEQDRSAWDRAAIAEGTQLLAATLGTGPAGSYQVQAAIAALHAEAASFAATDWPQILALYTLLQHFDYNPMVALNRAIAAAMVHGPAHGLELLRALAADPRLANHYRLAAVRAHLCEMAGDRQAAIRDYRAAAAGAANLAEQRYLLRKASSLEAG